MSRHARIEEVSDSEPEELDDNSDPEEGDVDDILLPSRGAGNIVDPTQPPNRPAATTQDPDRFKKWQLLYPLYFDKNKTRAEGRRIDKEQAVENPLARSICDAVYALGLQLAFEAGKTHPRDWANPGRVRVLLKQSGKLMGHGINNKHHLYIKVAEQLRGNPTTEMSPMRLPIAGMPPSSKPPGPPATPRGWKLNTILPLHSAAVSGGGVSENLFKEMMAEMQGGGQAAAAAIEDGPGAAGKGKKKKIKA